MMPAFRSRSVLSMADYDVFNGDADGICALHQLRLAEPRDASLITGVKRDIELVVQVSAAPGDRVTVLDVSLDRNRQALLDVLAAGAQVLYVDHHFAGEIPAAPNLEAVIDTDAEVCTALLVNRRLQGRHLPWAVTAAYGDNLHDSAARAAAPLDLAPQQLVLLEELGTYINYNGYGSCIEDLFFHPADLYRRIRPYADPFAFIAEDAAWGVLRDGFADDMAHAQAAQPERTGAASALYILPDAPWARRVSGVFANHLARDHPSRAHALLTARPDGGFVVSVRAPLAERRGAAALCRQFQTGGGREAAAGINHLPEAELERFAEAFHRTYG